MVITVCKTIYVIIILYIICKYGIFYERYFARTKMDYKIVITVLVIVENTVIKSKMTLCCQRVFFKLECYSKMYTYT